MALWLPLAAFPACAAHDGKPGSGRSGDSGSDTDTAGATQTGGTGPLPGDPGIGGITVMMPDPMEPTGGGPDGDIPVPVCGDGLVNQVSEVCDDGNTISGDGCTGECDQVEASHVCPTPGQPCVYNVTCGDGLVGGAETCDDGTDADQGVPVSGDGCSDACQIEDGYTCPVAGAVCRPVCGDGLLRGREECDDAADASTDVPVSGDGCDANCQLEPGWVCPEKEPCRQTVCGDSVVEGSEQCDDGNSKPYDGCSAQCTLEPRCGTEDSPVGACVSTCGDGIMLASDGEACDDGNALSDDGCGEDCRLEPGYECTTLVEEPPDYIDLPVVLRDFQIFQSWTGPGDPNPEGHPDMNRLCCALQTGIVEPELGADRKPVYSGMGDMDPINQTSGESYFNQWYRDVDGVSLDGINLRFDQALRLVRQPNGSYSMDSAVDEPWVSLGGFFPLDDVGWGNENLNHNFFFTSEVRYWFEYKGGEELLFSGDDDVWVFINGRLAVDLGGVHTRSYAMVLLGDDGHGLGCTGQNCTPSRDVDYQMEVGNIYEVVVFHAERHPGESNYWLTLTNFLAANTKCAPVCGDGIVTPDEACDLGAENNTGEHGGCNPDCSLAPFCGDGLRAEDFGEACDDAVNTSLYGGCAPGCVLGPYCGDGIVQSSFEQCDDGTNDGGYRECHPNCVYGARCGDGIVQEEYEECDEGADNGSGDCLANCSLGVVQ